MTEITCSECGHNIGTHYQGQCLKYGCECKKAYEEVVYLEIDALRAQVDKLTAVADADEKYIRLLVRTYITKRSERYPYSEISEAEIDYRDARADLSPTGGSASE